MPAAFQVPGCIVLAHALLSCRCVLRRGEIGSWKDRFTVAQSEAFDKLCRQRMAGSGLEFDFE